MPSGSVGQAGLTERPGAPERMLGSVKSFEAAPLQSSVGWSAKAVGLGRGVYTLYLCVVGDRVAGDCQIAGTEF